MDGEISRRKFVRDAAITTGALALGAPAVLRAQSLNSKLDVAIIGCGGRGGGNMQEIAACGENIVALCDVNRGNLEWAAQQFPKAKTFTDFRKLYDEFTGFDAVAVSTCEHTHAFATLPALKMRKHVYCEKPLTHNVWECRQIRQAARAAKVATQMGTQIHAGSNYRRVVELVQSGAIGPVRECHVWVGRAWGLQSKEAAERNGDIVYVTDRPTEAQTPPANLDWDLWLGPAPARPYHEVYFPGPKWYRWWDFGNGTMSDLGSHWNDLPFWALKLDAPKTIVASGPIAAHPEIAPATMQATYTYGARGPLPPVTLTFYQGELRPPQWMAKQIPQWGSGALFVGEKGMLLADYGNHLLLPEEQYKDFERPPHTIPESIGHHKEWTEACKTGAPTTCNFEYAAGLTEANHLGNVAYRAGQLLEWDTAKLKVTNTRVADGFIRRRYRKGWKLG
ncbi:MAG: Gfo/Idh/MocA family oxidoreductase [Armatimonadetes bacterium]|nr:Gfo/Idh/MocA family oxidoreductase [Armatimonadota bacterium]